MERWKKIERAPDYEVSDHGRVRRTVKRWRFPPAELSGAIHRGYHAVIIYTFDGKKKLKVHRLVCEAFNGPPPSPAHVVAHQDHDKLNNHFENLRWKTQRENVHETIAAGRHRLPGGRLVTR